MEPLNTPIMRRDIGDKSFPVWLLGDSNPKRWQAKLKEPFDPRHPIRHNIWTSVLDVIQDRVYRQRRLRLDSGRVYIRNAVEDPEIKPEGRAVDWGQSVMAEVLELRNLLQTYRPLLLVCFGAFSFEFACRSTGVQRYDRFDAWGTAELGKEFRERTETFDAGRVNVLPLLHRSVSGGKFLSSHRDFCDDPDGNYFDLVGGRIAALLLAYSGSRKLWVS